MHSFIFIYSLQNAELDLQQEEYALYKNIDVSLWIDFREFYGNFQLQEVLGGNFVVVNENLHAAEFAEFKGKVLSYIGTTHCLVKGIEVLKVWSRSTKAQLKPVHVLGNIYFLMSPYDLDELCEWVRNKSFFLNNKDFTIDGLLEYEEQCNSSSISSRVSEITNEEHNDHINYQPVCSEWQKERCALLGLTFISVNHPHLTQASMTAVSHCPLATARIAADGNCFFRSVSLAVTGSQEFHEELHLLITTYMIHKSTDPMLSSLGSPDGSMESYMKRSRMQTLGTWATELEVIVAASLLNTTTYIYAKCGETFKWLKHSPQETKLGLHQDEGIYITSFN